MSRDLNTLLQTPDRPSARRATFLAGLATTMFPLALLGWLVYDGANRVVAVGLVLAIGIGNFCWAIGSLIPDGTQAKMLRAVAVACSLIMAVGLVLWAALQVTDFDW